MASEKSTIVRTIRTVFAHLEDRSPALGGRLAEYLWFRLPAPPRGALRRGRTPSGGEAFEVRWEHGVVRGRVYGDRGRPTAYLVHGWGGWWQQLGAFVQPLVDEGLCVVAFDGPSHGDSGPDRRGPRTTTFVEMAQALAAVEREFGRATVVVAHSAGALSTMAAMSDLATGGADARPMPLPEALAFIAAPTTIAGMLDTFSRALGIGPRSVEVMRTRAERRIGRPMDDFDLLTQASSHPRLPRLLLVHDTDDAEASVSAAVEVSNAWHDSRLVLTEGLGHRRPLWDPAVVKQVVELGATAADAVRAESAAARRTG
ncbi:alpha/beta hydrolase [Knoellia locipacati]|uniref:alpha/beta hydrolase n=1 Tax=Knoellia locipacati TaxID=882824 RepID=UPI00384E41E4